MFIYISIADKPMMKVIQTLHTAMKTTQTNTVYIYIYIYMHHNTSHVIHSQKSWETWHVELQIQAKC